MRRWVMIIRDLYRCPAEDLHRAIAASDQTVLRRGSIGHSWAIELADVAYLVAHPDFDPSLSSVAYEGAEPVAFLVSRMEATAEGQEAIWSLFGGRRGSERASEMVLDAAMDQWRKDGAKRARKGLIGLIGTEPRMDVDADLLSLLTARGFEVTAQSAEMAVELKKLAAAPGAAEREAQMRQKGYVARTARPDEVAVVARQFDPRHTGLVSQEFWNVIIRGMRPEGLVVLEHRRQLIGYAACLGWTLAEECPELGPVFVEPAHRGTGLGGMIVRHALAAVKQAGKARVKLNCAPERIAFYQRLGFTVAARFCREAVLKLE